MEGGRFIFGKDRLLKNEHTGNRTQVLGPEIPCTTTMLYALVNIYPRYTIISILVSKIIHSIIPKHLLIFSPLRLPLHPAHIILYNISHLVLALLLSRKILQTKSVAQLSPSFLLVCLLKFSQVISYLIIVGESLVVG